VSPRATVLDGAWLTVSLEDLWSHRLREAMRRSGNTDDVILILIVKYLNILKILRNLVVGDGIQDCAFSIEKGEQHWEDSPKDHLTINY
jgi:hypothetical protein